MEIFFQTAYIVGEVIVFPEYNGDIQPLLPSAVIENPIIFGASADTSVSLVGTIDNT